uniref:Uncharacterized protein n=1 Tax=Opuntia streptacantha TaxID=393608 RepID=A0A7C9CSI5_OPUST
MGKTPASSAKENDIVHEVQEEKAQTRPTICTGEALYIWEYSSVDLSSSSQHCLELDNSYIRLRDYILKLQMLRLCLLPSSYSYQPTCRNSQCSASIDDG